MKGTGTTISVSKKFHDWLNTKGKKGESYEDIIRRMLKPEFQQELEGLQSNKAQESAESASDLLHGLEPGNQG